MLFDTTNSQLQNTIFFFNVVTTISYAFLPLMSKGLHASLVKIYTSRGDLLLPVLRCTTHCAHIHCLVSVNTQQELMYISGCHFFSAWKNSGPFLCFIRTSMSDAILSGCPSAAIFQTATTCDGILVGRFSFYCCTTNICLWRCGPTQRRKRHYFWNSLHNWNWIFGMLLF